MADVFYLSLRGTFVVLLISGFLSFLLYYNTVKNGLKLTQLKFHHLSTNVVHGRKVCPKLPPDLAHRMPNIKPSSTLEDVQNRTAIIQLQPGGRYTPQDCRASERVAVIVPYRNREQHLPIFLAHMHNVLQRQQREYTIFIVELALPTTFNRGLLANVGFAAASSLGDFSCFIVHDVDLLVADDRNIYRCSSNISRIRHMSVSVSKQAYILPYLTLVGGVTAIQKDQFLAVNGFSNIYFGWGGEDDDLYQRLNSHNYTIERPSAKIGRYEALPHKRDKKNRPNPYRLEYLRHWHRRAHLDGLRTLKRYTNFTTVLRPLFTRVYVTADEKGLLKEFGYLNQG